MKPINYPRVIGSENITPRGITVGEDDSTTTEKKVWTDAEQRAIEDNRANRELACSIDALTSLILTVEKFSILGSYDVHSSDDENHSETIKKIKDWVKEFGLLKSFRESFKDVKVHGIAYFQKLTENGVKMKDEAKGLQSLQQLVSVDKFSNPFNSQDYYLYQKLKISQDWKDPENTKDPRDKRVFFIRGGMENVSEYPAIKAAPALEDPNTATGDSVINLEDIIEIKNNESGDSAISAALNEIYIKNLIMLNLPNLVYLVVAPGIELITKSFIETKDSVIWQAPQYPESKLQESNNAEYTQKVKDYNTYQANIQTVVDNMWSNWLKKGVMSHSDRIDTKVMESNQAMNPEMLNVIVGLLNTEIAFALGFPLSLLDAKGAELATARSIFTTISTMLKGIQDQYQTIALNLIYEQFPKEAETAGITFTLSELNPQDAKDLAEVEKSHAAILKIYKEIGASDDDLKTLSRNYNLLAEPEMGGEGTPKPVGEGSAEKYSEEDMAAAVGIVRRVAEDRKTVAIDMEGL